MTKWLAFHCIVIKVADVNMKFHKDKDEARRKHFTKFLENKIKRVSGKYSRRENTFRIWADTIHSRYDKSSEVVEKILCYELVKLVQKNGSIKYVEEKNSKETPQIQLCDLLLGAVMEAWQAKASSYYKHQIQRHLASHLGWQNLRRDTDKDEAKFNIWYFFDPTKGKERDAKTQPVTLKYPL